MITVGEYQINNLYQRYQQMGQTRYMSDRVKVINDVVDPYGVEHVSIRCLSKWSICCVLLLGFVEKFVLLNSWVESC